MNNEHLLMRRTQRLHQMISAGNRAIIGGKTIKDVRAELTVTAPWQGAPTLTPEEVQFVIDGIRKSFGRTS